MIDCVEEKSTLLFGLLDKFTLQQISLPSMGVTGLVQFLALVTF